MSPDMHDCVLTPEWDGPPFVQNPFKFPSASHMGAAGQSSSLAGKRISGIFSFDKSRFQGMSQIAFNFEVKSYLKLSRFGN